jgi:hypothetical protein
MRSFSREGVRRMLAYKEAAREHRRARIEASAWELEEMIQLQQVIEYVGDTEQEQWKSRAHEAEIVRRLLFDGREVTENITQLTAIRPKEQFELDALDNQLDDLKLHAIRTGLPIFTDDRVGHEPIQLL